jgi:hypothetical protein
MTTRTRRSIIRFSRLSSSGDTVIVVLLAYLASSGSTRSKSIWSLRAESLIEIVRSISATSASSSGIASVLAIRLISEGPIVVRSRRSHRRGILDNGVLMEETCRIDYKCLLQQAFIRLSSLHLA